VKRPRVDLETQQGKSQKIGPPINLGGVTQVIITQEKQSKKRLQDCRKEKGESQGERLRSQNAPSEKE